MANCNYELWNFIFAGYLPSVAECVQAICSISPSVGSAKQRDVIMEFSKLLKEQWDKAFGSEYVITSKHIKKKLEKHILEYASQVLKKKGNRTVNMRRWNKKNQELLKIFVKDVNVDTFNEPEKLFYEDQVNMRRTRFLSGEVDEKYVIEQEQRIQEVQLREETENLEMDCALGDAGASESSTCSQVSSSEADLSFSSNRSGKVRKTGVVDDVMTQTEYQHGNQKPLRSGCRNFNESIKIALASSCARANISSDQSRKSFQASSEVFYEMKYYLSPDEAAKENSSSGEIDCEQGNKKPRSKEDYAKYEYVLPSKKSIERMKHLMAIQEERNAALALLDALPDEVITIKYDTTTRRRLKGEWPSIILKSSSGKKYRLRSLHMSHEDRQNIVQLFITTFGRLAIASGVDKKLIWSKIGAIMTDSVSKNLGIGNMIAASLSSLHIPLHLLCASHTCEAFDSGNLKILATIEAQLKIKQKALSYMPFLRSFLSKGVCQAALNAFCKLTVNDGSKSSLHEEFDLELEKNEVSKKFSAFKERRFGLLGYTAAAQIFHMNHIKEVLSTTASTNQLVQACKMYSSLDYVLISLKCIAWFTYKVTLPFLNMVELTNPSDLLDILPKLSEDLAAGKYSTLDEYHVEYSFKVDEPKSPLGKYILDAFATRASTDLQRQRGREYGFGEYYEKVVENEKERATDLTKVDKEVLKKLDDDNLDCERDLSHMDKLAIRAASCSNRSFTAKGMKDDMTLYQSNVTSIDDYTRKVMKVLDEDEKQWFELQKAQTKARIEEKRRMAKHGAEQINHLIAKCKLHGGPFTVLEELEKVMKDCKGEKEQKKILRWEISLRKHTSSWHSRQHPELYKVNKMSTTDMKVNLSILLSDEFEIKDFTEEEARFPSEEEMLEVLHAEPEASESEPASEATNDSEEHQINEPVIVIWDVKGGRKWYVGFVKERLGNDMYVVDHMELASRAKGCKGHWRWPAKKEECEVETDQIIPVNVIGSWDLTSLQRKGDNEGATGIFVLDNWEIIEGIFASMYKR